MRYAFGTSLYRPLQNNNVKLSNSWISENMNGNGKFIFGFEHYTFTYSAEDSFDTDRQTEWN